jgi:hypothetical protein
MNHRPRSLASALPLAAALAAVTLPAVAGAQTPAPPAATPVPAPAPAAPTPAPATTKLVVVTQRVGATRTVLVGDRVRIRGVVSPYVPGQKVVVRVVQGGRKVFVKQRQIVRTGGTSGTFLLAYTPKAPGSLVVTASHRTTPELRGATAHSRAVSVLPRAVSASAHGLSVRLMQRRLKALGYVLETNGSYDAHTSRAVLAFRKLTGMNRVASADTPFFRRLAAGGGVFKVRFPQHGRHVEGDLTHQVMALIGTGGHVERIYPISSGKPSTPTVLGTFAVYRRDLGINAKGMVDASYFHNGYAIHGYAEVPVYAASHGCLRTPVPDARSIHDWLRLGTIVDVYYR